ncbi:MAG: ADP-ribosyltransferase [Culicoidibacterales bacterium]
MQFFTEQTMDQFLAESGQALDYVGVLSNSKPEKQEKRPFACWTFGTETQSLGLIATNIQQGRVRAYKRNKQPSVFNMFETFESGKTSTKIVKVAKPLQVFATVATIIAEELKENKQMTVAFIRYPSTMGASGRIVALTERYLKKYGLSNWNVGSTMSIPSKKVNYLAIARKENTLTFDDIFNTTVNEELFPKGVPLYQETPLTDVEQEALDNAGKKIELRLEPKLKAEVPDMISLKGVAGNVDVPEHISDFIKENPSVIANKVDYKTVRTIPEADKFTAKFTGVDLDTATYKAVERTNNVADFNDDSSVENQAIKEIGNFKIEMKDIMTNDAKILELRKLVEKHVKLKAFGPTDDIEYTVEKVMILIVSNIITKSVYQFTAAYEALNTVKPGDRNIVSQYTGSTYGQINGALLNSKPDTELTQESFDLVKNMDTAFERSGIQLPKDVILYRSMKLSGDVLKQASLNKLFHFRTFVSTSLNPELGLTFAE